MYTRKQGLPNEAKLKKIQGLKNEPRSTFGNKTKTHIAACTNDLDSLTLLKDQNLLEIQADIHGNTPLLWAIANSSLDAALFLITHCKNTINTKCTEDLRNTPLCLAVSKGRTHQDDNPQCIDELNKSQESVINLLLENGADTNLADINGNTPLHFAVLHRDTVTTKLLIDKGAKCNLKNKKGQIPVDMLLLNSEDTRKILQRACEVFTLRTDEWVLNETKIRKFFEEKGISINPELLLAAANQKLMDHLSTAFDQHFQLANKNHDPQKKAALISIKNDLIKQTSELSKAPCDESTMQNVLIQAYNESIEKNQEAIKSYTNLLEKFKVVMINILASVFTLGIANIYNYHKNNTVFFKHPIESDTLKQSLSFKEIINRANEIHKTQNI